MSLFTSTTQLALGSKRLNIEMRNTTLLRNKRQKITRRLISLDFLYYSTFANGEVKEFKEVREVKAICFCGHEIKHSRKAFVLTP